MPTHWFTDEDHKFNIREQSVTDLHLFAVSLGVPERHRAAAKAELERRSYERSLAIVNAGADVANNLRKGIGTSTDRIIGQQNKLQKETEKTTNRQLKIATRSMYAAMFAALAALGLLGFEMFKYVVDP